MENQIFNYKGSKITFQLGNGDVMVSANEMAKPFFKEVKHWFENESTHAFIHALAENKGIKPIGEIPTSLNTSSLAKKYPQLIKVVKGGVKEQGTWLHEDIALDFAQWLSIDFKLWCNDRIKELLKHGFTATQPKMEELLADPDAMIATLQALKDERAENDRLAQKNNLQRRELEKQAPKVEYVNEVLQSQSTYTTTQIAKEIGMSGMALNNRLKVKRIQYRQNGTYLLYSKYQGKGYTKTKTHTYTDSSGIKKTAMQTVWTEKGRVFIHQLFKTQ